MPQSRAARPNYEFPRLALALFALDLVLGRRRSFVRDSETVMAANPYSRQVEGLENIPREGPFILVMNHYNREGLHPYHCAMAVTAALKQRRPAQPAIRWAFTSELQGRRIGPIPLPLPLVRWVFRRIAHVYGLVVVPRAEEQVAGRGAALLRLARLLQREPIGLTPEAAGSGRLIEPPVGSGRLLQSLARKGFPLIPVGVWEDGGILTIRFGQPFVIRVPSGGSPGERDRLAREQVMVAIGRLLPEEFWGVYAEAVQRSLEGG